LELSHARLAYLSACSTAITQNQNLLDEAVHLAAGFQLAGFPHVIGTLWPILDATAAAIANDFYLGLTDPDGTLHPERAAQAIHQAIRIRVTPSRLPPRAGRPTSILVLDKTTNRRKRGLSVERRRKRRARQSERCPHGRGDGHQRCSNYGELRKADLGDL